MKNIIRFSTDNDVALNHFKPEPIKNSIPNWYAELNVHHERSWKTAKEFVTRGLHQSLVGGGNFTAKACMPLLDYMTSGYLIRTFSDVSFSVESENGSQNFWYVSPNAHQVNGHTNAQLPNIGDGIKRDYIKFNNPWIIRTEPGYSCLFYQPEYFFERRFRLFPGIVDTDTYDSPVNFPGILTANGNFVVDAGTPLMCVFPFKRTEFIAKIEKEKRTEPLTKSLLRGGYKKFFRAKKSYE